MKRNQYTAGVINPPNNAIISSGLARSKKESYNFYEANQPVDIENYKLMSATKNPKDRNDIANRMLKLVSSPNYYNFDTFNLSYGDVDLSFKLLEDIANIEHIKLDQVILPNIPGFEYYDMYLSIEEIKYGYRYNNEFYQFNMIAEIPNTYVPVNKVIMKPVHRKCILERNVDFLSVVTFKFRDDNFQEIPFPKAVIRARTVPATNPIQIIYTDHGLVNGDTIYIKSTTLCGTYIVTVIDPNTFTIPYNGTLITDVLHPIIQIPKFRIIIRINFQQFNGY